MEKESVPLLYPVNENTVAKYRLGVLNRFVIVYVGSFGGWYPTDKIMDFYEAAKRFIPSSFAMVLTKTTIDIKGELLKRGYSEEDMIVTPVNPADIPSYVCAADVALSFRHAGYSAKAASPTKIAEYLACGVPVISNKGIGDVDDLITRNGVGALLDDYSDASYRKAFEEVIGLYQRSAEAV